MPAKRRKPPPKADSEVNLTPMIDVVFNLIIFFMVITDLTQKDIEFLILPKAELAAPDKDPDPERIIINIIDLKSEANQKRVAAGELSMAKPPIMMGSRQVESLEEMRKTLRKRANPTKYPDVEKGQIAPGIYPSKKPVLVRCDQGQIFGWVQAVMMYCTYIPGRPQAQELLESPLVYKMEIAVAEPTQ